MSGLLFLEHNDFGLNQGTKGPIMCHKIKGISLILFYSTKCQYCHNLIPVFRSLPGSIGGCQFGIINIDNNYQCVQMSQNTIAPIKYVPYIVLYNDGKPFMEYKGEQSVKSITKFIIDVVERMRSKQTFSSGNKTPGSVEIIEEENRIPKYTIGIPLYGNGSKLHKKERVCYLEVNNAYNK